jgi:hypothetical protein
MNRTPVLHFPQHEIRSFSVDPKTKEVVIRFYVGETLASDLVHTLRSLEGLIGHLRMIQESCVRQAVVSDEVAARKRRHIEVARTYQRLRLSGVKHRAAIRALFVDPAFSDLQACTSDIAWWVKAYALSSAPKEPS